MPDDIVITPECLQPDEAGPFLASRLPPARQSALEAHVEGCRPCQARLEEEVARQNPLEGVAREEESLLPRRPAPHLPPAVPTCAEDELNVAFSTSAPLHERAPAGEKSSGLCCPLCDTASQSSPSRTSLPASVLPPPPRRVNESTTTGATVDSDDPSRAPGALWPAVTAYEVLGELGRGGMGVVYKARDRALNRVVALKMILAGEHAGSEAFVRFQREAEAVARLRHPNIVQIYEVGQCDGMPFFSLEFCEGGSLHGRLKGTPVEAQQAAEAVKKLAEAVQAAHDAHILHRDLKPDNVLLAADGTPKISDFGLAKLLDESSSPDSPTRAPQTQTGAVVGTPSYMAPEQALGSKDIGPAADVYALGAILYECLTGRPPFRAATALDTLQQVVCEDPVPPRQLNARVPRDLETIALKCLHKEPGRRYARAEDLADDLGRYLAGEPIRARAVSRRERAVKWARRRPAVAALAVMIVLAVAGALTAAVLFGLYAGQRSRMLEAQLERHGEAETLLGEGIEAAAAGRVGEAESKLERALATLGAESAEDPTRLRERIEDRRERVQRQRQRLAEDERARRQVQEAVARLGRERNTLLDRVLSVVESEQKANRTAILELAPAVLRSFHLSSGGSAEEAARAFAPLSPYFEKAKQRRQVAEWCCEVLLVWADADAASGQHRNALRLLDQAEALGRAEGVPAMRVLHQRRAVALAALKDEAAAERERRRAAAVTPAVALDHFLLALESYHQKDLEEAQRRSAEALRLQPGDFWPQYLIALCHLQGKRWAAADAWLTGCLIRRPDFFWPRLLRATARIELKTRRDLEGAEADLVLAQKEARGAEAAYAVAMARGRLAEVRGRLAEAREHFRKAIQTQAPGDYQAHTSLAEIQRKMKNHAEALAELNRAIERAPGEPRLYHTRGLLQRKRGDLAAARRDFERAIALGVRSLEPWLASAFVELGYLKHLAGDHMAALKHFDAALKVVKNYPHAHCQRAETLLKLDRHAEAGQALDTFLAVGGEPSSLIHVARGLIHEELRDHPRAIEAFTRALQWERGADVLSYRGWAYLKTQSLGMALADFEEALKKDQRHSDALCGRGQVLVLQGKERGGIEDAEEALKHGKATPTLLCRVASIYAWAARPRAGERVVAAASRVQARQYEERAEELLVRAVRAVPEEERSQFWRERVLKDPALRAIRMRPRLTRLAASLAP
jgi:tetratricopeptide (TPR) repeat protein/tRNA A-37 threonylcarbamoyl transferase component Bud32